MTPKEYLAQAYRIDQRINSKLAQIDSLKALATKTTNTMSDMPRSSTPNPQRLEDVIIKIMDMESELKEEVHQLVELKQEMALVIKKVENEEYRMLLEFRYLCFMTWEEISSEMGYTVQHLLRIHRKAVEKIQIPKRC